MWFSAASRAQLLGQGQHVLNSPSESMALYPSPVHPCHYTHKLGSGENQRLPSEERKEASVAEQKDVGLGNGPDPQTQTWVPTGLLHVHGVMRLRDTPSDCGLGCYHRIQRSCVMWTYFVHQKNTAEASVKPFLVLDIF